MLLCACMHVCSVVFDYFASPWTVACQPLLVHGIFQARTLEWVAISPGDLPDPGIEPADCLPLCWMCKYLKCYILLLAWLLYHCVVLFVSYYSVKVCLWYKDGLLTPIFFWFPFAWTVFPSLLFSVCICPHIWNESPAGSIMVLFLIYPLSNSVLNSPINRQLHLKCLLTDMYSLAFC